MRYPSATTLQRITGGDRRLALKLRRLLDGRLNPTLASPRCAEWVRQCYNNPSGVEQILCAADELIGTHGVECVWGEDELRPAFEYLNTGDSYAATLIWSDGAFRVSGWADELERRERRGERFQ